MSTAHIDYIDTMSKINLIFKFDDDVFYCDTINYKELKLKNIEDLEEYIREYKKQDIPGLYISNLELESSYLTRIIASYSKMCNRGIINWQYTYNDLSFNRMNKLVNFMPISIIVHVHPEMGNASGVATIKSIIINTIKAIYYTFKEIRIRKNTYHFFEENYGYDEKFIKKTVQHEYEWKKGFIDNNIYDDKYKYENKIMKDCDFKYYKKEKLWRKQ